MFTQLHNHLGYSAMNLKFLSPFPSLHHYLVTISITRHVCQHIHALYAKYFHSLPVVLIVCVPIDNLSIVDYRQQTLPNFEHSSLFIFFFVVLPHFQLIQILIILLSSFFLFCIYADDYQLIIEYDSLLFRFFHFMNTL